MCAYRWAFVCVWCATTLGMLFHFPCNYSVTCFCLLNLKLIYRCFVFIIRFATQPQLWNYRTAVVVAAFIAVAVNVVWGQQLRNRVIGCKNSWIIDFLSVQCIQREKQRIVIIAAEKSASFTVDWSKIIKNVFIGCKLTLKSHYVMHMSYANWDISKRWWQFLIASTCAHCLIDREQCEREAHTAKINGQKEAETNAIVYGRLGIASKFLFLTDCWIWLGKRIQLISHSDFGKCPLSARPLLLRQFI